MSPRAQKQCGHFGCDILVSGGVTYCDGHLLERRRAAPLSPTAQNRNPNVERVRRKAVVNAWVSVRGWTCPGWMRDPHPSTDLTAAHATAVALGGGDGPLTVLCRSCNSRQALSH